MSQKQKAGAPSDLPSEHQKALEQDLYNRAGRITHEDELHVLDQTPHKLQKMLDTTGKRAPVVKRMIDQVQLLYKLLRDPEYKLQWSSKGILIGALIYFITPFDFFPDFIPIVGYIDDAFVISTALNALAGEIERFSALRNLPLMEDSDETEMG